VFQYDASRNSDIACDGCYPSRHIAFAAVKKVRQLQIRDEQRYTVPDNAWLVPIHWRSAMMPWQIVQDAA
jgi:hypothetical protein